MARKKNEKTQKEKPTKKDEVKNTESGQKAFLRLLSEGMRRNQAAEKAGITEEEANAALTAHRQETKQGFRPES